MSQVKIISLKTLESYFWENWEENYTLCVVLAFNFPLWFWTSESRCTKLLFQGDCELGVLILIIERDKVKSESIENI